MRDPFPISCAEDIVAIPYPPSATSISRKGCDDRTRNREGFAAFDTGLQAMAFAKELGNYAASKHITIRTGIHQGEVAFTKRGAVGPAVLRADAISARAPHNRIAILADVWRNLDRIAKNDWRFTEIAPDILALELAVAAPSPPRPYITVPLLPPNYVERPEALARLRLIISSCSVRCRTAK